MTSAAPVATLQIRVLGPLDIRVAGEPLVADTRKALAILALLAVEGRAFARDELAAMFWPEADDASARGSLRRTLSTLRTGLADRWLAVDRSQVSLPSGDVWVDLAELEALASAPDVASLARAADLARGPFLAGFNLRDSPDFDDWRAARGSAVERLIGALLDDLADRHLASGDLGATVRAVTRRLELDPLDEPTQRRLIGLLADSGDRGGAVRQYRACVTILERELGVTPLAETTALYESIRDGSYITPHLSPEATPLVGAPPRLRAPAGRATSPAVGTPTSQSLPFVGRAAELAALADLHRSSSPDGRVAVVEGEPGIGKTRLAAELVRLVSSRTARVLASGAHASESGIAYGPIAQLLRRAIADPDQLDRLAGLPDEVLHEVDRLVLLPGQLQRTSRREIPEAMDPGLARARLVDALVNALTALLDGPEPGLLVLDDLQGADASTLELVGYLVRRLEARPMLLLLSWRPEDLTDQSLDLARLVETRPDAVVLRLGRLDQTAVAELVAAALPDETVPAGMVAALAEASEGLPLYLVERLVERPDQHPPGHRLDVPVGLRALHRERLGRVGETAAQILAAGAVIGRSFDLATVRAASGRSEEETLAAIEELIRRGVVREAEAGGAIRFDFAHASLRDVAYEQISLVRRRVLHRRVAEALRARVDRAAGTGDLARLVQIAQHERDAGRDQEAAEAFRQAAGHARGLFANHEAIELLEQALALGHSATGEIQRALGELRLGLGEYAGAIAAFETAAASATRTELAEMELLLGRAHARRGDLKAAASHLDAALAESGGTGRPTPAEQRLRIRALVERSLVALRDGDQAVATRSTDEALVLATELDDQAGAGMVRRIRGLIARSEGDLAAARAELTESVRLGAGDPDPAASIAAANALALVEAADGRLDRAIELLGGALDDARRIGERHLEAAILNNLADAFHAAGETEQSMARLREAVALFAEIGGKPGELEPEIWKLESW